MERRPESLHVHRSIPSEQGSGEIELAASRLPSPFRETTAMLTARQLKEPEYVFQALEFFFKTTVHGWPVPMERAPRFWEYRKSRREVPIHQALRYIGADPLTQEMRDRFYRQVRIGQDVYEDAGGYVWRCWQAMLGLPYRRAEMPYSGITEEDLIRLAGQGNQ